MSARRRLRTPEIAWIPRRGLVLVGLALSVLIGTVAGPWVRATIDEALRGHPFVVARVAIQGAGRIPAREIAATAALAPGTPLVDIDVRAVEARLRRHPWLASARALRLPPSELLISVREREPRGLTTVDGESGPFFVDAEGVPFVLADPQAALPNLRTASTPSPGRADPALARAITLADALAELGFAEPTEISVAAGDDPTGFTIRLPGLAGNLVLGSEARAEPLQRLVALVGRHPTEVANASLIDLRFADRAVLRGEVHLEGGGNR